ncbi:hypothetical protein MNV49_006566 [Pseudohyphozyma bogoriensis]|nr:hypothetical protein MNV49_006566 [Pseudohyphozyma bogoriensis]
MTNTSDALRRMLQADLSPRNTTIVERQTQILPPVTLPPILLPGLGQPITITVPGVVTVGLPDADHPFKAPGPTDQRGGCPGLNIMANYGYISRTGITTAGELLYAQQEMLGLSYEFAAILTAIALNSMTDLTTLKMSIGLTDSRTNGPLSFLFGTAPGLFSPGSHNKYEIDGSMFYTDEAFPPNHVGNVANSVKWQQATAIANGNGGLFDLTTSSEIRYSNYQECVSTNPQCTWLPPIQFLFYAAEAFTFLIFPSADANGNPEAPTTSVVNTFMGAQANPDGTFTKVPEQLPPGSTADSFIVSGPQLPTDVTGKDIGCLIIAGITATTPVALTTVVNALVTPALTSLGC